MKTIPVSLCMIVHDTDEELKVLADSIKKHDVTFQEIVIVDTGFTPQIPRARDILSQISASAVKRVTYAPRDRNEKVFSDFAEARNVGWDLATSPYLMWLDSDDVFLDGHFQIENLLSLLEERKADFALCPYNYTTDQKTGLVTQRLYRERIVRKSANSRWANPVHEYLRIQSRNYVQSDLVTVTHRRSEIEAKHPEKAIARHDRNVTILEKWKKETDDGRTYSAEAADAHRMLFYLAFETGGQVTSRSLSPKERDEVTALAINRWNQYLQTVPWTPISQPERTIGLLQKASLEDRLSAPATLLRALYENNESHEVQFAVARMALSDKQYDLAIYHAERILRTSQDPKLSRFMTNPTVSTVWPYHIIVPALLALGKMSEAFERAREAYRLVPTDKGIQDMFLNVCRSQTSPDDSKESFRLSPEEPVHTPPLTIPQKIQEAFALQFWKQIKASSGNQLAGQFLDLLPFKVSALENQRPISDNILDTENRKQKGTVTIWTGPAWKPWTPQDINDSGIGGSETAAFMMAQQLVERGWKVTVLSDPPTSWRPKPDDQITIASWRNPPPGALAADIFICSRQALVATRMPEIMSAKKRILWIHDVHAGDPSPEMSRALGSFDKIFCLSEWHKSFVAQTYKDLPPEKIFVTRNGIDLNRFNNLPVKDGNRLIYSSSPDRGLELLLAYLPEIRKHVPDVTLDVYYGFETWKAMAKEQDSFLKSEQTIARIEKLERALDEMGNLGHLTYHGRVGQETLAKAFLRSKVWAYPTWFTESSCITALEAQAAECVPVATALAALPETVHHGYVIKPPPTTEAFQTAFVNRVVSLLKDETLRLQYARAGRNYAFQNSGWEHVGNQWDHLFQEMLRP